jgi:hypothetical protein
MRPPALLIPVLALAAIFFGWRTYEAWTTPVAAAPPPSAAEAAVAPAGPSPADPPPPVDLSGMAAAILARPVFRPDRTPYHEETTAAAAPKRNYDAEMARFTLLGVLLFDKEKKGVVVGASGTGRQDRWEVGPGDALPGFTVKDIGADGITLTADGKEFLLPLYAGGPKGPPGQAPVRTDVGPPRAPAAAPQPASPPKGGTGSATPPGARSVSPTAAPPPPPPSVQPGTGMPAPREPLDLNRNRQMRPTYLPGRR